ncbi:toxin co-regulated pilus biosynthesis Q family protein [Caballeronia sp. dw_19]|uniref:toxin co-regulated pilus biosynthesis Q family protein n=1 Tax=Caballeronia sp. dw_19 TaxID=2719791 RepID=UPI001BD26145|nr:toxin co-regulated pilus biosynthesis Q family protein [Caballeronia sp. dw_19]
MTPLITIQSHRCARLVTQLFAVFALTTVASVCAAAIDPDQSRIVAPAGDGWQMLSAAPVASVPSNPKPATGSTAPMAGATATVVVPTSASDGSLLVAPVFLPSTGIAAAPTGVLTIAITPQDINLRNALDRWLQVQGWQLAWKIDDDLPLEFNATFSGDFKSVLTQVMQATNHMRTPTRVCKHTNNVIRVVARAANCQD